VFPGNGFAEKGNIVQAAQSDPVGGLLNLIGKRRFGAQGVENFRRKKPYSRHWSGKGERSAVVTSLGKGR